MAGQALSIAEQQTISEALIRLISSKPNIPKSPEWQYLNSGEAIGVYTMPGAVYTSHNILGGYTGNFPFMIRYQATGSNTKKRIANQKVLDDLGEWLETATYPSLTDNRLITSIERTATSYLFGRDADNNEIWQINMMLKYKKEV